MAIPLRHDILFFFSSRRRHTRSDRDWSSDVCSSDLEAIKKAAIKNADGSLSIPRTALKDAIFQTKDFQGITGPLTCISTGDCQSQSAVNIGVFQSPDVPTNPATPDAKAIFSENITLSQALGT